MRVWKCGGYCSKKLTLVSAPLDKLDVNHTVIGVTLISYEPNEIISEPLGPTLEAPLVGQVRVIVQGCADVGNLVIL